MVDMGKKMLVVLLVCGSFWLAGCMAMQPPQRGIMNGNIVYSSRPDLEIKVSPVLGYVDTLHEQKKVRSEDDESLLDLDSDIYLFVDSSQGMVNRGVTISIRTISSAFLQDIYRREKPVVEAGTVRQAGENWEYYLKPVASEKLGSPLNHLKELGLKLPRCFMAKGLGRFFTPDRDILVDIRYLEKLDSQVLDCKPGSFPGQLSAGQFEYIKTFSRRFREVITIR